MGLQAFLSRLGEEFCVHATVATRETVDLVDDVLDSVCSLVAASFSLPVPSSSSSSALSETAAQDYSLTYAEELSSAPSSSSSLVPSQTASQDDYVAYSGEDAYAAASGFSSSSSQAAAQDHSDSLAEALSSAPFPGFPAVSSRSDSQGYSQVDIQGDLRSESQADSLSCVEEVFSERESRVQVLKQAQDYSDVSTPAPATLADELTLLWQDSKREQSILFCEQNLCGFAEGASLEEQEKLKKEEEGRGGAQSLCDALSFSQSSSRSCSIEDLDTHCLLHMMSFLDSPSLLACSLVCQEWLEASNFARSHLKLQGCTPVKSLLCLLTRFDRLLSLRIVTSELALPLENPSAACFDDLAMGLIGQHCKNLQRLSLIATQTITDEGLAAVLMSCSELQYLGLSHCGSLTGEGFSRCDSLELDRLVINLCSGLTNKGLIAIAKACSGLRDLSISSSSREAPLQEGIQIMALLQKRLEKVAIHACGISDDTITAFALKCKALSDVLISCEYKVTDAGVASLRQLPCLEKLTLKNNPEVLKVPRSGSHVPLKALHLSCWWGADSELSQLAEEEKLEEVSLMTCTMLSNLTIKKLFGRCRQLRHLVVADSKLVTPEVFASYVKSGSKARLEFRNCKHIKKGMAVPEGMKVSGKVKAEAA